MDVQRNGDVSCKIASPERPAQETAVTDLSPSKEALAAAFPVLAPASIPQQDGELETALEGRLPDWLSGSIVRNGPGAFSAEMKHSFDGFACLVKFTFRDGKVYMRRRFLESDDFKDYKETGTLNSIQFGSFPPLHKVLGKVWRQLLKFQRPAFTDNASVNTYLLPGGKQLVAMTETLSGTLRVDAGSLHTEGHITYNDDLKGDITTAHPVIYPDGSIYNLFIVIGGDRFIAKVDPVTQKRTKLGSVPADNSVHPPWVHDIPATENYIIVPDTPILYDFSLSTLRKGKSEYGIYKWDPSEQKTRFHFVPKNGGEVKRVDCNFDYMAFHFANAFESPDGQEVYIDVALYDDPAPVNALFLQSVHGGKAYANNSMSRITVPLNGGEPSIRTLVPLDQYTSAELGRVNPNYKFHDYKYIYVTSLEMPTKFSNALSKLDVKNGTSLRWSEPGSLATEPLMLPRPGATEEDDGVVTSMIGGSDGKGYLLILDAKTFKEIARAKLPSGLPYGFHNQYYPA